MWTEVVWVVTNDFFNVVFLKLRFLLLENYFVWYTILSVIWGIFNKEHFKCYIVLYQHTFCSYRFL
jgi:hypothetical protein